MNNLTVLSSQLEVILSTLKQQIEEYKFKYGKLYHQQLLKLYAVKYNNCNLNKLSQLITVREWNKRTVDRHKLNEVFTIRFKSPKLSKVLTTLGLSEIEAGNILSEKVISHNDDNVTEIKGTQLYCLEQGNSIHYRSCQATDNRAAYNGGDYSLDVDGDLLHIGKDLFMWTVGSPMIIDGEGFTSRVKLRICRVSATDNRLTALFVDKIYGNKAALLDNVHGLEKWWSGYCFRYNNGIDLPIYIEDDNTKNEVILYSASAKDGYQDSFSSCSCTNRHYRLLTAHNVNLIKEAYTHRLKEDNVYLESISEVDYNPQSREFKVKNRKEVRVNRAREREELKSDSLQSAIKLALATFGKVKKIEYSRPGFIICTTSDDKQFEVWAFFNSSFVIDFRNTCDRIICTERGITRVEYDYPEGGFMKAESIEDKLIYTIDK